MVGWTLLVMVAPGTVKAITVSITVVSLLIVLVALLRKFAAPVVEVRLYLLLTSQVKMLQDVVIIQVVGLMKTMTAAISTRLVTIVRSSVANLQIMA